MYEFRMHCMIYTHEYVFTVRKFKYRGSLWNIICRSALLFLPSSHAFLPHPTREGRAPQPAGPAPMVDGNGACRAGRAGRGAEGREDCRVVGALALGAGCPLAVAAYTSCLSLGTEPATRGTRFGHPTFESSLRSLPR